VALAGNALVGQPYPIGLPLWAVLPHWAALPQVGGPVWFETVRHVGGCLPTGPVQMVAAFSAPYNGLSPARLNVD
jgi:hypothetical protein